MNSGIEKARVRGESLPGHPTLFPLQDVSAGPVSPQSVCNEIGLNWLSATRLFDDGWLSFDPRKTSNLDAAQEAELVFLGALVNGGCDQAILKTILSSLHKPYAYRIDSVYYDWTLKTWRMLEDVDESEQKFREWLEQLVTSHDLRTLQALRDSLENAVHYVRGKRIEPIQESGYFRRL